MLFLSTSSWVLGMMIFLSYVKMHFFYVKSNNLRKWSNILRKLYVTMFIPEHSLLRRSIPFGPPGPPLPTPRPGPPPTSHLARPPPPPTRLASLPTRRPIPPCLPPLRLPCRPQQARRRRERCNAPVPSSSSCNGGVQVNVQPPPIFYIPLPKFYIPHLKFYTHPPKIYVPYPKIYVPHLKFYTTPPIFYINLTCEAAVADTRSARPLPQGVVNC